MTVFYAGGWLALLMVSAGVSAANPAILPDTAPQAMPAPPPDTRCRLSVSSPVVDYGTMSRGQLNTVDDGQLSPGMRSLMLSVVCPYERVITLRVDGEASAQGGLRYGTHGTTHLHVLDVQLDGNAVGLRAMTQAGVMTESHGERVALNAGQRLTPVREGRPATGKTLTARLDIQPVLTEAGTRVGNLQRSETRLTLGLDD